MSEKGVYLDVNMRIRNLKLIILLFLLAISNSLSISNSFVASAATQATTGNQVKNRATVLAAKGENILEKLGKECKNLDNWSDGDCDAYQSIMTNQLNCGDGKMFQKAEIQTDPQDSSVTKTKWFVDPNRYSECLKKAIGFATAIKDTDTPPDCSSMAHGGGVEDGGNWKECEKLQNKLFSSLGCSNKMFTDIPGDNTHDTFKPNVVDACLNSNIKSAASITLVGPDGQKATFSNDGEIAKIVDKDGNDITDQVKSASTSDSTDDTDSNCSGGPMGWLFCPMIEYMANTINAIAGIIDSLMQVRFMAAEGPVAQIEKGWRTFLSFANIMLVIAFLIIIFSQATQAGLSNYNVKRMLPRLVVAAILMNISFYFCAFLIDISNIFGASVMGLFIGGDNSISSSIGEITNDGGGGLLGTVGAVAAAATLIGILIFVLPFVLLSIVSVFIMLIGRQVILMCLVLVSSLAFVAWLLPNTEQYFQKWWKYFTQLLVVYPMIMLVFGASLYLSNLLGSEAGVSVVAGESDSLRKLVQLIVLMIPVFAIPGLLKGSSAIMGRISSAADNVSRQVGVEKLGTGLQGRARDYSRFGGKAITKPIGEGSRRLGRGARNSGWGTTVFGAGDNPNMLGRGARAARNAASPSTWKAADKAVQMAAQADRDAKKQAIDEKAIGMINASGNRTIGGNLARVGGTQLVAAAGIQAEEAEKKRVQGIYATMRLNGSDINALSSALSNAIASGDHSTAAASIQRLRDMGAGGVMSIGNTLTSVGQVDRAMQSTIENTLNEGSNYSAIVARDAATAKGGFVNGSFAKSAAGLGEISAEQMATQTSASLGEHAATASAEQAREVMNNPTLRKSIVNDDAAYILTQIATGNAHAVNVNTTAPQGWQRPNNI